VAWLFCRDDSQRYSVGASKLTSEEARRIGKAISRIPEFMMQRQGFYPRGGGPRWRRSSLSRRAGGHLHSRPLGRNLRALPAQQPAVQFDRRDHSKRRSVESLRVRVADGRHPVLGSLQGPLAARHGVSLSRAATKSAVLETDRELAEVQSARRAVTDRRTTMCNLLFDHDQPGGHAQQR
jgi:hypothetical protein